MSSRSLMHRVFPPSEPPDGGCPQSFRPVVGGTQLRGSWYLSAIVRLQGFSSVSPAASPRRRSPETVTTSSWVGRSKPGCDLGPTLSFKDVHHQCWGGECAELGSVSARAAARSFPPVDVVGPRPRLGDVEAPPRSRSSLSSEAEVESELLGRARQRPSAEVRAEFEPWGRAKRSSSSSGA